MNSCDNLTILGRNRLVKRFMVKHYTGKNVFGVLEFVCELLILKVNSKANC